jgi:adenine-specific DNA-methyltransferase
MKNTTTNNIQKVKDDLIAELDKRIADKIIEKTNADLLKKLIEQAETINEAIMIAELGTTYKRTGFHFDKRLEKMTDTIKYFKKNGKLSFAQDKNALTHKLIIGDNYDALLNLLIEYRGKIDVIYIDPPYGKDSMGEFAKTNYENAITRDNLLSMLYPRLVLARQLLSDNGVIFCSIDDRNQPYLKCLFDEIFEEKNFLNNFIWINNLKGRQILSGGAVKTYESILLYAKNDNAMNNFIGEIEFLKKEMPLFYKNADYDVLKDDKGSFVIKNELYNTNSAFNEETRKNLVFNIHHNANTGEVKFSGVDDKKTFSGFVKIEPHKNNDGRHKWHAWRWSKEKILNETDDLFFDDNKVYTKIRELGKTNIKDIITDSTNGNNELQTIFDTNLFSYPKPVKLLKFLISLLDNQNAVVLDFFAGSGTTGQAVLELNKQDGGKRHFILATANEITDTTPNGIVNDVTSKRLKRVMTGECYDGTKDFKWNEKNKPLGDNLDVYDIATVANFESTKDKTPFDVIDETLYGQEKLGVKEKIKWVCENFEGTQKTLEDK